MNTRDINVAIIGCGGIANAKHLPAISELKFIHIVAFCDLILERAQKSAEKYGEAGARTYTDYEELLRKEKDIEVVYVLTPNRSHSTISIAAMEAGHHVLCEKPMAKSYADAKAMLEASKRTGRILSIGYQNRFRPDSIYLKRACENGELGEIYYAKAHAIRRRSVPTWGVFLNEYEQGGGPLIDIGTHALDLTLWMMDNYKPARVMGSVYKKLSDCDEPGNTFGPWDKAKFTVEDSAFGYIIMENGATIVLESSWALNTLDEDEAKTSLCGTEAGADMKNGLRINGVKYDRPYVNEVDTAIKEVSFFKGGAVTPQVREQLAFYNSVLNGAELIVKPEQAIVVTQILEAIYESAKTGTTIIMNS